MLLWVTFLSQSAILVLKDVVLEWVHLIGQLHAHTTRTYILFKRAARGHNYKTVSEETTVRYACLYQPYIKNDTRLLEIAQIIGVTFKFYPIFWRTTPHEEITLRLFIWAGLMLLHGLNRDHVTDLETWFKIYKIVGNFETAAIPKTILNSFFSVMLLIDARLSCIILSWLS